MRAGGVRAREGVEDRLGFDIIMSLVQGIALAEHGLIGHRMIWEPRNHPSIDACSLHPVQAHRFNQWWFFIRIDELAAGTPSLL